MSENRPEAKSPANPDNPYNIDFARERRLTRIFQITIGAGFLLAALLLILGYMMDFMFAKNLDDGVPPVTPYDTPAQKPLSRPVSKQ